MASSASEMAKSLTLAIWHVQAGLEGAAEEWDSAARVGIWMQVNPHVILSSTVGMGLSRMERVGREGIEPSWVAPGDFKSHTGMKWPYRLLHTITAAQRTGDFTVGIFEP